jgi:hypothetical protein|tara:strand:- start:18461 stop:18691 length:231 start_codon:yes stop_codon:yes gene_type:complete
VVLSCTSEESAQAEQLATQVVNLRRALACANRLLTQNQQLNVACDEQARPSFREASAFHAEVRRVLRESSGQPWPY